VLRKIFCGLFGIPFELQPMPLCLFCRPTFNDLPKKVLSR
jgi:hypothetical protein